MLSELGELCLVLATGFSGAQMIGSFWGVVKSQRRGEVLGQVSQMLSFSFLGVAFFTLMWAFVVSDFSLYSVALHGHRDMPLLYRICAVWGHHEGSLLLWTLFSSSIGVGFIFQLKSSLWLSRLLAIQGMLTFLFLLFLLLSSNPFEKLPFLLPEGESLNPLLQDRALSFHPPILYAGYVGMASLYTFAFAALWRGDIDKDWTLALRPWALGAWGFLTLGIAMGSWWAYYELGWGGWWFWDPVENASLIPWLSATAFLHTLRTLQNTGSLKLWTLSLGILTFGLCLLGTFLVRSGLITSVHAFALDPERGIWIFSILLVVMGLAVGFLMIRARNFISTLPLSFLQYSGWMVVNSLVLMVGLLTVIWGTFYPLILQSWNGSQISVGPPFYEATFVPMMMPLLLIMGALPFMSWTGKSQNLQNLSYSGVGALIFLGLGLFWVHPQSLMVLLGLTLLGWLFAGTLRWGKLTQLKVPGAFAHFGFGISILGMMLSTLGKESTMLSLQENVPARIGHYELTLQGITGGQGPNYVFEEATLVLSKNGDFKGYLRPERRLYWPNNVPLHETAIWSNVFTDVYVVLNEELPGGGRLIRATIYPFVSFIWMGCLIMALGALVWVISNLRLPSRCFLKVQTASLFFLFSLNATSPEARALFEEIRCPVCIGQSVVDSGSEESLEIKSFIETSLNKGFSQEEIKQNLVLKYGERILLNPPFNANTYFLWGTPFALVFLVGGGFVIRFLRRR
ncbi:Cytochrome c-type biogenesis CcmF and CcmH domain-containing protein [Candidatus Bealeia paramacronuclearis]|uniref:Cytochrome c-type biogenesis protein n=1 Tax=Candidatus Bealeia paramacronuclearis TaxID=1921001 RepID=A0ABZ2C3F5_9PROT|nr:Cytochrome c-type biogenesis CcmF and CcmH domain-containing protein [Candidatus Bealeia paramacronuclearis]